MTVKILQSAETDLEAVFNYYHGIRFQLAQEFLDEFRHGLAQIIRNPNAWQQLDRKRRRYRLNRFPYGIIYEINDDIELAILSVWHLKRKAGSWRRRRG